MSSCCHPQVRVCLRLKSRMREWRIQRQSQLLVSKPRWLIDEYPCRYAAILRWEYVSGWNRGCESEEYSVKVSFSWAYIIVSFRWLFSYLHSYRPAVALRWEDVHASCGRKSRRFSQENFGRSRSWGNCNQTSDRAPRISRVTIAFDFFAIFS